MKLTFKKIIIFLCILPASVFTAVAQKNKKAAKEIRIPMEPAYWKYDTSGVDFIMNRNVKAIHIKKSPPLIPKNVQFSNGTIEYDIELGFGFPGITFHQSADGKKGDIFYLRYFGTTSPEGSTTLQYAAIIDSTNMWNLTNEYQAGATLNIPGWNHVKLVVHGRQMKAYVNDMGRPAMIVPQLEGDMETGSISFSGDATIANFVIKPDSVEDLPAVPGYISTYNDTRYLRKWQVTQASDFAFGKEIPPTFPFLNDMLKSVGFPDSTTAWTPITAEHRGIVNLTRALGRTPFTKRRLAWLRTSIESDSAQERTLHLGFCDEIWLYVNGQILYTDKNHFGTPGQKFPRGRCTIENAVVKLPLKKGKNEVLIGLANYFYGWGIIARLDNTEGIHLGVD
jgi:hypothetical protein